MREEKDAAWIEKYMSRCGLCPWQCHVDRTAGARGRCGQSGVITAARAALHMWEEPCISGTAGSGAVFFSGCTLRCVYCQNHTISSGTVGKEITAERLAEIFLELQAQNAWNINLVTAGHFAPQVIAALESARTQGLSLPVVYNTSGYEREETLRMLEGYVDIWLPDFKYMSSRTAQIYSGAADYAVRAKEALAEMVRQTPEPVFEGERMMRGVIVRHLVLPGMKDEAKDVIRYLYETYRNQIHISILNQYTPVRNLDQYPQLQRRVTKKEYDEVVDYAIELGVEQGFIQEGKTAEESFIPPFDITGI